MMCPPEQFVPVGSVVSTMLLTPPRCVSQGWATVLTDDVHFHGRIGEGGEQGGFQIGPRFRRGEREPIRAALQDRIAQRAVVLVNMPRTAKHDRSEVVAVVWTGEPCDRGLPAGSGSRDPEVVEGSAATQQRSAPRAV